MPQYRPAIITVITHIAMASGILGSSLRAIAGKGGHYKGGVPVVTYTSSNR